MKLISVTAFAFLVNIAAADSPPSRSHDHHNIGLGGELIGDAHDDVNGSIPPSTPELAAPVADSNWDKALASGSKLHVTLPLSDKLASWYWKTDPHHNDPNVQTVQSPYDGDMKELFRHWGYKEPSEEKQLINIDKDCDFEGSHKLKRAFDDLGIGTKSKLQGGPNVCLQIDHADGPAVLRDEDGELPAMQDQKYIDTTCGKEYRVSPELPRPCNSD